MKELPKKYNFREVEKKWQEYWVDNKIFKFDWKDAKKENVYAVDTPPPHVSGELHMGHVFGFSQMDCVTRYFRMKGMNVYNPVGYDDNGLPSERYVEKKLGIKSKEMERQKFVKICDKEIRDAEKLIRDLFKRAGYSFDWDEEYRTISDMSCRVSQMSFIDLYNKGVLYQKEQPVIWDVIDQTALAQTEAEDKEIDGEMNYLKFEVVDCPPENREKQEKSDNMVSEESWRFVKAEKKSLEDLLPPCGGVGETRTKSKVEPVGGYNKKVIIERARELRHNLTNAEGLLWNYLKNKQSGYKFRKQAPIGKYIVDFVCFEKKLIVELDGGQHGYGRNIKYDNKRSEFLRKQGFNIIRIWNNEMFTNTEGVLESISNFLERGVLPPTQEDFGLKSSSSWTPPQGGSKRTAPQGGGKRTPLEIMTTRPELLPACVAVMYHPDDNAKYKGKFAITPLGVTVPMIADEKVDKEKGTGVVMCCTFGDQTDVEWWKTHNLDLRIVLNEKGLVTFENIKDLKFSNEKYKKEIEGLFVEKARKKILELLKEDGKLMREPVKIKHSVKTGERSKYPLEILVKKQWLIKVLDIKKELHEKAKEVNWHPKWMEKRIHDWIDGLAWDWCITRQRFFGVPVPVYYISQIGEILGSSGKRDNPILPNIKELPIDPMNIFNLKKGQKLQGAPFLEKIDDVGDYAILVKSLENKTIKGVSFEIKKGKEYQIRAESDIFDTWATSAVSPQLSIHGITEDMCHDKERFKKLQLPFALRAQGGEIIRTWAFCTIVKAYYHQNTIPWKDIMINGLCLAPDGTKMSKSKGNIINPVDVMNEYSIDAMRYWTYSASLGSDTAFSKDVVNTGSKLVTKLFNASKFASYHFKMLSCEGVGEMRMKSEVEPVGGDNKLLPPTQEDFGLKSSSSWTPPQGGSEGDIFTPELASLKADVESGKIFETADLWLISKLCKTIEKTTKAFEEYEYSKARETVENFFWNDFCDNYLEIAKLRCYGAEGFKYKDMNLSDDEKWKITQEQQSAIRTLYGALNAILKLFAPFVPHVTEEIFSCVYDEEFAKNKSLHARGMWPKAENFIVDDGAEASGELAVKVLAEVRKYKSDNNLSMKNEIQRIAVSCENEKVLDGMLEDLKNVCNAKEIVVGTNHEFKVEIA